VPRRVWAAAGWQVAGRIVGSACTLAMLVLLGRHLADDDFGRLTFWLAVFLVLDGIVDFGAGQVAVQRSAAAPAELAPTLRTARRARLGTATLVVVATSAVAFAVEGAEGPFVALAALYQLSHVLELSTIGWRNAIRWRSPTIVRAGASIASLLCVLALRATGEARPLPYLLAIAVGSTLGNVALHVAGRRGLPDTRGVDAAPLRPFLAASIPIGAAAVCQQLYFHVDNVFVRAIEGEETVGHYNVAVRIMGLSFMGAVFAATAALPWLARAHRDGRLLRAAGSLALASGALGAAVTATLFPLRAFVLGWFGEGFAEAEVALGWLLLAGFAVHLGAPLLTAVVARGAGRTVLVVSGVGLAINLAGNALLVPRIGMNGAAAATLATEAWVAAAALVALLRGDRGRG